MDPQLTKLQQVWETLGNEDPLWAVVSHPEKRGGRWDVQEFLATGEADVARARSLLARWPDAPQRFGRVLDFGCGVGRLSQAWRPHADHVTGVDISEPMILRARRLAEGRDGFTFLVNTAPDLAQLPSASFDLCYSHICLQHIPWPLARGYIAEFGRLCRPGGWVVFQLCSRPNPGTGIAGLRQRMVDALPFGLGQAYRRWRHGSSVVFDVYYTPREQVLPVLHAAGLEPRHQEPDQAGGPGTEGFIYLSSKPTPPS